MCSYTQQRIQVWSDPPASHRDLSAAWQEPWLQMGSCRSSGVTVLHWELCWPLFGCGAPLGAVTAQGQCPTTKWCIQLLTLELKSTSDLTHWSCKDANPDADPVFYPVETRGLVYLKVVYNFNNKNTDLVGWVVQSNPHHVLCFLVSASQVLQILSFIFLY